MMEKARQRCGRAGRHTSGICYRLYREAEFFNLDEETQPEILRCNLSSVVLQLLALNVTVSSKFMIIFLCLKCYVQANLYITLWEETTMRWYSELVFFILVSYPYFRLFCRTFSLLTLLHRLPKRQSVLHWKHFIPYVRVFNLKFWPSPKSIYAFPTPFFLSHILSFGCEL